jgi:hypothetical protein
MKIKFSHKYRKLLDEKNNAINQAALLEVIPIELSELSPYFMDYDTDHGEYKLPAEGKYLMLVFLKPGVINTNLFTTIRRFTPEKYKYYKDARGEMFEVQIPVLEKKLRT